MLKRRIFFANKSTTHYPGIVIKTAALAGSYAKKLVFQLNAGSVFVFRKKHGGRNNLLPGAQFYAEFHLRGTIFGQPVNIFQKDIFLCQLRFASDNDPVFDGIQSQNV